MNGRTGLYVRGDALAQALDAFRYDVSQENGASQSVNGTKGGQARSRGKGWEQERPPTDDERQVPMFLPARRLSDATGFSYEMIRRYINNKAGEWITLERADAVLTAAGVHYLLHSTCKPVCWWKGQIMDEDGLHDGYDRRI